jgi:hypothetical protein
VFKQEKNQVIHLRLQISLAAVLLFLSLCFYIYPKFNLINGNARPVPKPELNIVKIPITVQDNAFYKKGKTLPEIPVTSYETEMLDSVSTVADKNAVLPATFLNDSNRIEYYSALFPEMYKIDDFNPAKIIAKSKKIYNFKNYFAYRMHLLKGEKSHDPSSPLADEALNNAMGKPNGMIGINIPLGSAGKSKFKNVGSRRPSFNDLAAVKDHFNLLEWLYQNPGINLTDLYKIKPVGDSYTRSTLKAAMNDLYSHNLVNIIIKDEQINYSAAYSCEQMIEQANRILTRLSKDDNVNREFVYSIIHQLVMWS